MWLVGGFLSSLTAAAESELSGASFGQSSDRRMWIFVHFIITAAVGISEFELDYQNNTNDGDDVSEKRNW